MNAIHSQQDTSYIDQPTAAAPAVVEEVDYALEIRLDRLKLLWRVTLYGGIALLWIGLTIIYLQGGDVAPVLIPFLGVALTSALTHVFMARGRYAPAAWSYSLGMVLTICLGLMTARGDLTRILPFAFVILVFVVGLLLKPGDTLLVALISAAAIVGVPALTLGTLDFFSAYHFMAIIFAIISALIAIQVTGDLYQISEWAMSNYQRERRAARELFDSKAEVQKQFIRAQVLSEELKASNEQLAAARAAAEEAKHYRGQFLANMSHELRTPLNAIIGFSETMLKFPAMYDGVKLPSAYEADLGQIYTSGRQLLTLINDILDLAKVDAGKLDIRYEQVDLKAVINTVISTAAGLVQQKPIKLELDLPDPVPNLWADRARVSQVLLNLYSNAAKFTDQGYIRLTVREAGDNVHLSVTDTGCGIASHNLEVIFEEFKQAESDRRDPRAGAGLGLAISRTLVNLMNGRIWAESELGVGSTFHVVLPRYRGQDQPTAKPEEEQIGAQALISA